MVTEFGLIFRSYYHQCLTWKRERWRDGHDTHLIKSRRSDPSTVHIEGNYSENAKDLWPHIPTSTDELQLTYPVMSLVPVSYKFGNECNFKNSRLRAGHVELGGDFNWMCFGDDFGYHCPGGCYYLFLNYVPECHKIMFAVTVAILITIFADLICDESATSAISSLDNRVVSVTSNSGWCCWENQGENALFQSVTVSLSSSRCQSFSACNKAPRCPP